MYTFEYSVTIEMKGTTTLNIEQDFVDRIKSKDKKTIDTLKDLIKQKIENQFENDIANVKEIKIKCKD